MRWGGLSFEGVSLKSEATGKRIAILESVEIDVAWLRALGSPRKAIDGLRIAGMTAELEVAEAARLRKARSGGASASSETTQSGAELATTTALPPVSLDRAQLQLRDEHGKLAKIDVTHAELAGGGWKVALARAELGEAPGEVVSLAGVTSSGPVGGTRPQVALSVVETATLAWMSPDETPDGSARARLKDRILALRSALRGERVQPAETQAAAPDVPLWTSNARLELRNAKVLDVSDAQQRPILEKLGLALTAEGTHSIRVQGEGATATGGSLVWDLHVTPQDARIEGRIALAAVPLVLFAPVLPKLPFHELEQTRVAADLAITGKGLETADVRGELSISNLTFASEKLARAPVGPISFTARGQGTWTPARRELSGLSGEVSSGGTRLLITGALAWPKDAYRVDLSAELPSTKCGAVLETVPEGLLDELSTIRLGGDIKGRVDMHVDSADLDSTKLDFTISDKCKFVSLPEAMNAQRFSRPFTHRVLEPDGTMFEMDTGPGTPAWTPIELISPFMIQAVVAHEDGRFFTHRGFAEAEIGAALARNLKARAFKFGASTITMQLVKNVFLHRDKLLSRKVQEALIVWWLEQQVDKKWILELYLNVIEYGTGVYGIRNAALHYFGTLPIHLTPAQAAFLGTILPSPKSYDEQFAKGTLSESTKRRVTSFLQHMRARDRIDDEALAYGLEELAQFRFYDPDQPPPAPAPMRGSAQAPPFAMGTNPPIETFDPQGLRPTEDGSFGLGL